MSIDTDTVLRTGSGKNRHEAGQTSQANCDFCLYYEYDEEYECMTCSMDLDEDEMMHFLTDTFRDCPYFRMGDEYTIVRKQN